MNNTQEIEIIDIEENTSIENKKINSIGNFIQTKFLQILNFLLGIFIKPNTTIERIDSKLDNYFYTFIGLILFFISSSLLTIFNLIFDIVVYREISLIEDSSSLHIDFSRINNFPFLSTIIDSIICFSLIILVITITYYIVSLTQKKQISFSRLIAISTISLIPFIFLSFFISPLLGLINNNLETYITFAGLIYSYLILFIQTNNLFKLKGDNKILINFFSLLIITILSNIIINDLILNVKDNLYYFTV